MSDIEQYIKKVVTARSEHIERACERALLLGVGVVVRESRTLTMEHPYKATYTTWAYPSSEVPALTVRYEEIQ